MGGAERSAVLDLHTGLGPFGVGELIASHPDGAGKDRLDAWYDDYTLPSEGTSVSADVSGDVLDALEVWVDGREITGVAIEWGTVDIIEVSNALRADAWLHAHSDPRGPEAGPIKAQLASRLRPRRPGLVRAGLGPVHRGGRADHRGPRPGLARRGVSKRGIRSDTMGA